MRRALAINERLYGVAHPEIATGLNNLAMLLASLGRPGDAEPLQRRAVAISQRSWGTYHPNTRACERNLASIQDRLAGR